MRTRLAQVHNRVFGSCLASVHVLSSPTMSGVSWGGTGGGGRAPPTPGGWGGTLEIGQRMLVCSSLQYCTDSSAHGTAWVFVQSRALFFLASASSAIN